MRMYVLLFLSYCCKCVYSLLKQTKCVYQGNNKRQSTETESKLLVTPWLATTDVAQLPLPVFRIQKDF